MIEKVQKGEARAAILKSIRDNLAASAPHDSIHAEIKAAHSDAGARPEGGQAVDDSPSLFEMFIEKLEAVGGHCVSAIDETDAARVLSKIINDVQTVGLGAKRIAISDSPLVQRLIRQADVRVDEITVTPGAAELFDYDVGISSAQGAIAETGTLVLEAGKERHRLLSLVPPVHIAIIEAVKIRRTLGETLFNLHRGEVSELSRAITFITGPSRTADIELTLAIGVHGPKELYVIIIESSEATEQANSAYAEEEEVTQVGA